MITKQHDDFHIHSICTIIHILVYIYKYMYNFFVILTLSLYIIRILITVIHIFFVYISLFSQRNRTSTHSLMCNAYLQHYIKLSCFYFRIVINLLSKHNYHSRILIQVFNFYKTNISCIYFQ